MAQRMQTNQEIIDHLEENEISVIVGRLEQVPNVPGAGEIDAPGYFWIMTDDRGSMIRIQRLVVPGSYDFRDGQNPDTPVTDVSELTQEILHVGLRTMLSEYVAYEESVEKRKMLGSYNSHELLEILRGK